MNSNSSESNILELRKLTELNKQLLDMNHSLLSRIIQLYKKNHISLETQEFEGLLANIGKVLDKTRDQPKGNTNNTTDKETEPVSRFCIVSGTFLD